MADLQFVAVSGIAMVAGLAEIIQSTTPAVTIGSSLIAAGA